MVGGYFVVGGYCWLVARVIQTKTKTREKTPFAAILSLKCFLEGDLGLSASQLDWCRLYTRSHPGIGNPPLCSVNDVVRNICEIPFAFRQFPLSQCQNHQAWFLGILRLHNILHNELNDLR